MGNGEVFFYRRGIAFSTWGGGSWRQLDNTTIELTLCEKHTLTFDSPTDPRHFQYKPAKASSGEGTLVDTAPKFSSKWDQASHPTVAKVLGEGPWHFNDRSPLAFLWNGVIASPWGPGTYTPIAGSDELRLEVGGSRYRMRMTGCYTFKAVSEPTLLASASTIKGWVPMRGVSMEYTHWRDSWHCQL